MVAWLRVEPAGAAADKKSEKAVGTLPSVPRSCRARGGPLRLPRGRRGGGGQALRRRWPRAGRWWPRAWRRRPTQRRRAWDGRAGRRRAHRRLPAGEGQPAKHPPEQPSATCAAPNVQGSLCVGDATAPHTGSSSSSSSEWTPLAPNPDMRRHSHTPLPQRRRAGRRASRAAAPGC